MTDLSWPEAAVDALLEADFTRCSLYDELAARCGIRMTGGRERITAARAQPEIGRLLRLPRGVACLQVERTGMADGRTVEHRLTLVRGDRYAVTADWSARGYSARIVRTTSSGDTKRFGSNDPRRCLQICRN